MPRPSRPATNFTSDRHAFYAAWVIAEMSRSGLPVAPVRDADGNYTNRVTINPPLGGDPRPLILMIPPPPDDWDLLGNGANGPTFRGGETPTQ
jgi:hypothetical protein